MVAWPAGELGCLLSSIRPGFLLFIIQLRGAFHDCSSEQYGFLDGGSLFVAPRKNGSWLLSIFSGNPLCDSLVFQLQSVSTYDHKQRTLYRAPIVGQAFLFQILLKLGQLGNQLLRLHESTSQVLDWPIEHHMPG